MNMQKPEQLATLTQLETVPTERDLLVGEVLALKKSPLCSGHANSIRLEEVIARP